MRDIRNDLNERLQTVAKEKAFLEQRENSLKALLEQEEQRFRTGAAVTHHNGNHATVGRTPLSQFIVDALQQSRQALTLSEFKKQAEASGLDFGEKSPGRSLHRALVGLTENGYLECHGRGGSRSYSLKQK